MISGALTNSTTIRALYRERVIILRRGIFSDMKEKTRRTMPVCFTSDQLKQVEQYAKRKGMLNVSQAIEELDVENKN
jgi:hypothetical protein